ARGIEIGERQIDTVEGAVIRGAVLQVIEHLQGGAQRVRSRPGVAALAMQVEQLTANRCRRIAAILHQLFPIAVAQLRGVEPDGASTLVRSGGGVPAISAVIAGNRWL